MVGDTKLPLDESLTLKAAMQDFIQQRLDVRLEKLADDDPKREALLAQFQFDAWIEEAARRVSQIQVVTHSLKPIHPDAKGSNLYAPPESLSRHDIVGSHVLPEDFQGDVVGNAAALDVYKFLKTEYLGKSLLERVLEDDAELASALSNDREKAQEWMRAFASITHPRGDKASHTKAKQLYWLVKEDPTEDSHHHLLAPLYATSLAHRVFLTINEDRFSEAAKEARKARREERYAEQGYHDYPNLAIQKMGGTKPQNISQLNSERGGNNYLLASLPPNWQSREVREPLYTDSVFPRFGLRKDVQWLIRGLSKLLEAGPDRTMQTRNRRDEYVDAIIDELILFASQLHVLEPGWSHKPECRLAEVEMLWLDCYRGELDETFAQKRENADWSAEVRHRFANWLNGALNARLPMGDIEHQHWMAQLKKKLDALQETLAYV